MKFLDSLPYVATRCCHLTCKYGNAVWMNSSKTTFHGLMNVANRILGRVERRGAFVGSVLDRDNLILDRLHKSLPYENAAVMAKAEGIPYAVGFCVATSSALIPLRMRNLRCRYEIAWMQMAGRSSMAICGGANMCFDFGVRQSKGYLDRWTALLTIIERPKQSVLLYELLIWASIHPDDLEFKLGDYFEMYDNRCAKQGEETANRWVRRQAFGLAWERIKKIVAFVTLVSTITAFVSKHLRR